MREHLDEFYEETVMTDADDALEKDFEPTSRDVICARGRTAYNHEGNRRFRHILETRLQQYAGAASKQEKSVVVSAILEQIRTERPEGGFVRKGQDGRWHKCADHVCREKIGQGFRDLLHTRYRSSTKSKVQIRRERRKRERSGSRAGSIENINPTTFHRPTNSSDTLEPIPLEESFAEIVDDSLIYDCHLSLPSNKDDDESKTPINGADIPQQIHEESKFLDQHDRPLPTVTPSSYISGPTDNRGNTLPDPPGASRGPYRHQISHPPYYSPYYTHHPPPHYHSPATTPPRSNRGGAHHHPYYYAGGYHDYYAYSSWWSSYYYSTPGGASSAPGGERRDIHHSSSPHRNGPPRGWGEHHSPFYQPPWRR